VALAAACSHTAIGNRDELRSHIDPGAIRGHPSDVRDGSLRIELHVLEELRHPLCEPSRLMVNDAERDRMRQLVSERAVLAIAVAVHRHHDQWLPQGRTR
jgi:hypothetical protein